MSDSGDRTVIEELEQAPDCLIYWLKGKFPEGHRVGIIIEEKYPEKIKPSNLFRGLAALFCTGYDEILWMIKQGYFRRDCVDAAEMADASNHEPLDDAI
jgi:hypothetical protein